MSQLAGRLTGVCLFALQLAACSHNVQSLRLQESAPAGLPPTRELGTTPFFPQERYQCGPAALATVLVANDIRTHPDELIDKVYLPARQGSVPLEMEAAARSYGMLVYPPAPQLEAVVQEIAAGHPVLVLQNLGLSWWPRWHYAVAMGYDLTQGEIVLRSGTTRRYTMPMGVFEATWRRGGFWARVIVPAGTFPATAAPLPYNRAALALEQSGRETAALQSFHAATERWPDSAVGWLARGNLVYRLERYEEAEQSFRNGLGAEPANADLWNNLGYALAGRGCTAQAETAVRCAIALRPQVDNYQESLIELQGRDTIKSGGACAPVTCPSR
ncbi:MAG: PA2778 family cysteine peptidase [Pseudomonadota bacterium]